MTRALVPPPQVPHHPEKVAQASGLSCRYTEAVSGTASRSRVPAYVGVALSALAITCAATPLAMAAEPAEPPPTLSIDLPGLLAIHLRTATELDLSDGVKAKVPLSLVVTTPSVGLNVDAGVSVTGTTTDQGGVNVNAQIPVSIDLTTPVATVDADVNAEVDLNVLDSPNLVDASVNLDADAAATVPALGIDTALGASLEADVAVGSDPLLDVKTDLRLPAELAAIITPPKAPDREPLKRPPPVVISEVPPVTPAPPVVPPTAPPVQPPVVQPPTVTPPLLPERPPVAERPVPAPDLAPAAPVVETPPVVSQPNQPSLDRLRDVAVAAGRSIWLPLGLMIALIAYLLGQRLLDGGAKMASASRSNTPDDEIIEL